MSSVKAAGRSAHLYQVPAPEALWRIGSHPALYCLEADAGPGAVTLRDFFTACGPESAPRVRRSRG